MVVYVGMKLVIMVEKNDLFVDVEYVFYFVIMAIVIVCLNY